MNALTLPVLLIVEDQPLILMSADDALTEAGFDTVTSSSAEGALREIEADCTRFSALITDVDLGSSTTGWDIARRARQLCPNIPVVYMSGASHQAWSAEGVPKSVILSKPFAPVQLVTAVATLLNDNSGSTEAE